MLAISDAFVITDGANARQVRTIVDEVEKKVKEGDGPAPLRIDFVAVGQGGTVHVGYRQRDESGKGPLYTDSIDTYYQESFNGGDSFTAPLKVDRKTSIRPQPSIARPSRVPTRRPKRTAALVSPCCGKANAPRAGRP